jgi:hypothetical protein
MTVALVVAVLCLILTNHLWLALGVAWIASGVFIAGEMWHAPFMPDDEEPDR